MQYGERSAGSAHVALNAMALYLVVAEFVIGGVNYNRSGIEVFSGVFSFKDPQLVWSIRGDKSSDKSIPIENNHLTQLEMRNQSAFRYSINR
jgi:hypothetical protein